MHTFLSTYDIKDKRLSETFDKITYIKEPSYILINLSIYLGDIY